MNEIEMAQVIRLTKAALIERIQNEFAIVKPDGIFQNMLFRITVKEWETFKKRELE